MIDRRRFLGGSLALLVWAPPLVARANERAVAARLPEPTLGALGASPYVYVSPLRPDGEESTCHGEVWYAWLDETVVMIVAADTWKARSLARGLDRARLWVGDHGRWKGVLGRNEAFREAPSFDAQGRAVRDDALIERLLAAYDQKYPAEIGRWRDRMRSGYADGSRVLIRYSPRG